MVKMSLFLIRTQRSPDDIRWIATRSGREPLFRPFVRPDGTSNRILALLDDATYNTLYDNGLDIFRYEIRDRDQPPEDCEYSIWFPATEDIRDEIHGKMISLAKWDIIDIDDYSILPKRSGYLVKFKPHVKKEDIVTAKMMAGGFWGRKDRRALTVGSVAKVTFKSRK